MIRFVMEISLSLVDGHTSTVYIIHYMRGFVKGGGFCMRLCGYVVMWIRTYSMCDFSLSERNRLGTDIAFVRTCFLL